MDGIRAAMWTGAFVAVGALGVITALALLPLVPGPSPPPVQPLLTKDGQQVPVPTEAGVTLAMWQGMPVLVIVAPAARLDGVEALRGAGEATPSIPLPGHLDLRLFAVSAQSTHRGCTVGFNPSLGASRDVDDYDGDGRVDGRIMDPCSQFQWDAYQRAKPVFPPELPRLPVLDVFEENGGLYATGFDGDVKARMRQSG